MRVTAQATSMLARSENLRAPFLPDPTNVNKTQSTGTSVARNQANPCHSQARRHRMQNPTLRPSGCTTLLSRATTRSVRFGVCPGGVRTTTAHGHPRLPLHNAVVRTPGDERSTPDTREVARFGRPYVRTTNDRRGRRRRVRNAAQRDLERACHSRSRQPSRPKRRTRSTCRAGGPDPIRSVPHRQQFKFVQSPSSGRQVLVRTCRQSQ